MIKVKQHLDLLGFRVEDKVTDLKGVVASIGFDLYGCVQAIVNPGLDKEGKPKDQLWFDVTRLNVTSRAPVMPRPHFELVEKGPAEKPIHWKA